MRAHTELIKTHWVGTGFVSPNIVYRAYLRNKYHTSNLRLQQKYKFPNPPAYFRDFLRFENSCNTRNFFVGTIRPNRCSHLHMLSSLHACFFCFLGILHTPPLPPKDWHLRPSVVQQVLEGLSGGIFLLKDFGMSSKGICANGGPVLVIFLKVFKTGLDMLLDNLL